MYSSCTMEIDNTCSYLDEIQKNYENKIKDLILFAFGTEMSVAEFKALFKIAYKKDYDPQLPIENQLGDEE